MEETTFADIDLFYFCSFIFKKNTVWLKKATLQKKSLVEKELNGVNIDDIGIHLDLYSSMSNVESS